MKKFILTIALVAAAATTAMAQISVGAGYTSVNSKSVYTNGNASSESTSPKAGFYVEADYNIPLLGGVCVAPGIAFNYLTHTETGNIGTLASAESKLNEAYVAVPVNFNYALDIIPGTLKVAVYAGPTFNIGLSSKTTVTGTALGQTSTSEVNNYGDNSNYGNFDVMVGGGVAAEVMNMIRVSVGYNYGAINRTSASNTTLHDSMFYVGASYLF